MKLRALAAIALLTAACSPSKPPEAPAPPPTAPAPPPSAEAPVPPPDPFAIPKDLATETYPDTDAPVGDPERPALPALPKNVAAADKSCAAWAKRAPAKPKAKLVCAERKDALAALGAAMTEAKPETRDAALAALEPCGGFPAGLIRALRVDLAPLACGDAIVEPALKGSNFPAVVHQTLVGQALAARASRTSLGAPVMKPPFDKAHVLDFVKGPALGWVKTEDAALAELMQTGVKLGFYGRAVAAIETGIAEMRFVETIRALPIPDEFKNDHELADVYYGSLDTVLEPWKARARDALLVGLKDLATVGAVDDARVSRARTSLSGMFGGQHVRSLDALIVPSVKADPPKTVEARLAAALPTFYAGQLLDPALVSDASFLGALAPRGLPLPMRRVLARGDLSPEAKRSVALTRVALGRTYFRGVDFDEATALTAQPSDDDARLVLALALAMHGGPTDLTALVRGAPTASSGGHVEALDAIAKAGGPNAGAAAEDAALVLSITPADKTDATFFRGVAARFRDAAARLTDPAQKAAATKYADSAEDAARALDKKANP